MGKSFTCRSLAGLMNAVERANFNIIRKYKNGRLVREADLIVCPTCKKHAVEHGRLYVPSGMYIWKEGIEGIACTGPFNKIGTVCRTWTPMPEGTLDKGTFTLRHCVECANILKPTNEFFCDKCTRPQRKNEDVYEERAPEKTQSKYTDVYEERVPKKAPKKDVKKSVKNTPKKSPKKTVKKTVKKEIKKTKKEKNA